MSRALKPCSLAASLLCLGLSVQAQTQTATPAVNEPEAQAAADAGLQLEKVVVTGTTTGRSKMLQSVSVSTLSADKIAKSGAASSAELLRTVPGLRAESSGGEGNANLTVRGAPISAGGSRYLQLQEDGLPLLLIGDISFATADQFLRADAMVDSVQVVRGGSASTTATNAPAGIVNFLSKTGAQPGGSLAVSTGLDHRQARVEFDAGGQLSDSLSYQLAGYYRLGEGVRPSDVDLEDGGQLRLNLTQRFAGGFLRLHLKNLDDRTPTYLPVPVQLNGNRIERLAGIDPRTAFFFNSRLPQDVTADRNGNRVVSNPAEGLQVKNRSVGLELDAEVGNGFRLNSKLRRSEISGRFIGAFPAGSAPTAAANGANRYTGSAPVFSMHVFNSALDDMGNVFSDTRLARVFDLGAGLKLTGTAGLFWGRQTVAQTWFWNRYNVELKGEGARILDNAGNPTTLPVGLGTTTWGGCCVRAMDVDVTAAAPYVAATLDIGPWSIDASLRRDRLRGSGWTQEDNTPAADGSFTGWNPASRANVAWSSSHSSYSLGANYAVSRDLAVFGRASQGVSLSSPDRQFGSAAMTGGQPYPVNELQQLEAGLKLRSGNFNGFFTLFDAKTQENGGFEVTTRSYLNDNYRARGLEAELSYALGPVTLNGGATWTRARIEGGANDGKTPRRQADLSYQLGLNAQLGDFDLGATLVGTTKSYAQNDNRVLLPGYFVLNPYLNWQLSERLSLSFSINNLFDKLAYTEAEGQGNLVDNPLYVARALNGRSSKAVLRYSF